MKLNYKNGVTSVVLRVLIPDAGSLAGNGKTGLAFNTSGLVISTIADNESAATAYTAAASTIETISTLGTFAAPSSGKCRFREVDNTNHPGLYEIQIADSRWAVAAARSAIVTVSGASGAAQVNAELQLSAVDLNDPVRAGLSALPGASAGAAGGLPLGDASGRVDLGKWLGTAPLSLASQYVQVDTVRMAGSGTSASNLATAFATGTTVTVGQNNDKTGYSLTAAGLDLVMIDALSLPKAITIIAATTAGKLSGSQTATEIFKGLDGATTRVTATVDSSGNRTSVVYSV